MSTQNYWGMAKRSIVIQIRQNRQNRYTKSLYKQWTSYCANTSYRVALKFIMRIKYKNHRFIAISSHRSKISKKSSVHRDIFSSQYLQTRGILSLKHLSTKIKVANCEFFSSFLKYNLKLLLCVSVIWYNLYMISNS